jgi:import receptor subunit TOM70
MAPVASTEKAVETVPSSTLEKIKKSIEDKDWKFYCALVAGLTLAGAGAYYISSGSKKGKKKPESKKEQAGDISIS